MSGMSVSYYPYHQVVGIKTAEKPVVYRNLHLAKLEHLNGPVKLIDCNIGEFISKGSAEIYGSTIKTARVADHMLLQNSKIKTIACEKTVVDFGGNWVKNNEAKDVVYLRSYHSKEITPFCGDNFYLAKLPLNQSKIYSAL